MAYHVECVLVLPPDFSERSHAAALVTESELSDGISFHSATRVETLCLYSAKGRPVRNYILNIIYKVHIVPVFNNVSVTDKHIASNTDMTSKAHI